MRASPGGNAHCDTVRAGTRYERGQSAAPATGGRDLPAPGDQLGRLTILQRVGEGGMGAVYAAYDPQLDRRVAVKLMHPKVSSAPIGRGRFLREAKAMAQLRHENVVTVYDAGEHQGHLYLVMEFVSEGSLRSRYQSGARPAWQRTLQWFIAAGRGLAAAHAAGFVHRDFKPENVFVDGDRVLVGDFGLVASGDGAHPEAASSAGRLSAADEQLTAHDEIFGTPLYMAPEQFRTMSIDERADQYSFCVALYEALYGVLPFEGDSPADHVQAKLAGRLRPRPPGTVPRWLYKVLVRGLDPNPANRYDSMEALLSAVDFDPAVDTTVGHERRAVIVAIWGGIMALTLAFLTVCELTSGITPEIMLAVDIAILPLLLMTALINDGALLASRFNVALFGFGIIIVTAGLGTGLFTIACDVDLTVASGFRLLVWFGAVGTFAVAVDRRVLPACLFLIVALVATAITRPQSQFLLGLACLAIMANFVILWGRIGRSSSQPARVPLLGWESGSTGRDRP